MPVLLTTMYLEFLAIEQWNRVVIVVCYPLERRPGRPRAGDSVISATHRHPPLHGRPRDTPNRSLSSKPYTRFQLKEHVLCNEPGDLSPVWMLLFMFAFCSINTTLSLSRAIAPPPPRSDRSHVSRVCNGGYGV